MKSIQVMKRFCRSSVYFNMCCHKRLSQFQIRYSATMGSSKLNIFFPAILNIRNLGLGPTSKDFEEPTQLSGPLTKVHATELVLHLNDEERKVLFNALQEFESNRIKEEFEDKLAGHRWRSKLGRPSKVPTLGDVDPTGSYCPVPDDWLKKNMLLLYQNPQLRNYFIGKVTRQANCLFYVSLANSIPFIGFGFLDNFIMIIAGDRIESSMSAYITLSTMAAAALGNTFSDVIGIGSSYYVERAAAMVGLGAPALSPVQLDMPISRRFSNMGRVIGITLGCFLGMTPLLFKDDEKKGDPKDSKKSRQIADHQLLPTNRR